MVRCTTPPDLLGRNSRTRSSRDSRLEEAGFELFVPLGISTSSSWRSRSRKPHGAPKGSFSVAEPKVRIQLSPAESHANSRSQDRSSDSSSISLSPSSPVASAMNSCANNRRRGRQAAKPRARLLGGGTHADCEPDKVDSGPAGHSEPRSLPPA